MIKVLIADDHAIVRRGLVQILEDDADMVVVGEASTGRDVLSALREQSYDVLVLDIAMPDGGGLEVLQQLRSLTPDLPVLMLSMYPGEQYAMRALRAGATGYLTKESAPEELLTAIRAVAQGEAYLSPSLAISLVTDKARGVAQAPHDRLSDREYQVMLLLAQGQTVTEIAENLALSVKTVSTYRRRILDKLDVRNTAEIIRYAIERDLVE